jgi:hypothetical protein
MQTLNFLDPVDVCIFPMVYNQLKKGEWLKQSDLASRSFAPYTIDYITLQPKLLGKYCHNNGTLTKPGEPEHNAFGFVDHG